MVFFNRVAAFVRDDNTHPILADICLYTGGEFGNGDFYYTVWEADHLEAANLCNNYMETLIAALAVES